MLKALLLALLIAVPICAEDLPTKPVLKTDIIIDLEEDTKKPFVMEFVGTGKDASVIIEGGLIRLVNPRLPQPYDEVIMLNTPQNLARCLDMNDSIRQFSMIVRAVVIQIEHEKAADAKAAEQRKFHQPVDPKGPKSN